MTQERLSFAAIGLALAAILLAGVALAVQRFGIRASNTAAARGPDAGRT